MSMDDTAGAILKPDAYNRKLRRQLEQEWADLKKLKESYALPAPLVANTVRANPLFEPTREMLIAARDWSYKKYGKPIGDDAAIGCWKAMYAAYAAGASERKTDND